MDTSRKIVAVIVILIIVISIPVSFVFFSTTTTVNNRMGKGIYGDYIYENSSTTMTCRITAEDWVSSEGKGALINTGGVGGGHLDLNVHNSTYSFNTTFWYESSTKKPIPFFESWIPFILDIDYRPPFLNVTGGSSLTYIMSTGTLKAIPPLTIEPRLIYVYDNMSWDYNTGILMAILGANMNITIFATNAWYTKVDYINAIVFSSSVFVASMFFVLEEVVRSKRGVPKTSSVEAPTRPSKRRKHPLRKI